MDSVKYQIIFHYDTNSLKNNILESIEAILKTLGNENINIDEVISFSNVKAECKTIYQETKLKN